MLIQKVATTFWHEAYVNTFQIITCARAQMTMVVTLSRIRTWKEGGANRHRRVTSDNVFSDTPWESV